MTHPSEQDLVLYFYGDAPEGGALERHLAECGTCAAEFAQLRHTLSSIDYPVPERAADYETQLWSTLRPRLNEAESKAARRSAWSAVFQPRRWAIAGALAVVILAAFLAGRYWPEKSRTTPLAGNKPPSGGSDRVLMVAVGDHLDRTEMVLVELVNTRPEGKIDISAERDLAQSLVNDNRLYRQTAQRDKDPEIAGVLDQVERTLIDIAHQPDSISGKQLEDLQKQIESQGILFKVRVIESQAKARGQAKTPASANVPEGSKL
jgi:hypothetical protein